jgi:hypothetical protein
VLFLAAGIGETEIDELASFSLIILITSCGVAICLNLLRKQVAGRSGDNQKFSPDYLAESMPMPASDLYILPQ